jgi:hypothetical protein
MFLNFVFHLMFSLFVPCQQECEELYNKIDTLKDENSVLAQTLAKLSEECLELANENDSIEVHHFNSPLYLLRFIFSVFAFH